MDNEILSPQTNTIGLLLAAGQGSRFGGDKLRHRLENGTPMGLQAALNLKQAVDEVICLVRPEDKTLIKIFSEQGFTVVKNSEHRSGLSSSIRTGIKARPDADYWLIALGDMPYIQSRTYQALSHNIDKALRQNKHQHNIIRPVFSHSNNQNEKQPGHPVAFPNRFKDKLLALSGDIGAASIVNKASHETRLISVNDAGILKDVDERRHLL